MTVVLVNKPVIDWAAIDCGIFDWVECITCFEAESIIWRHQNLPQPPYPFATLFRSSLIRVGFDEQREVCDLTQPAGQEIELQSIGIREFTLSVQIFVDEDRGANDPECNAVYIASKLQASTQLETIKQLFCGAGLAVIEELAVQDLSDVINGVFVSRANLDIRFRVSSSICERTGYIDKIELDGTKPDVDGIYDV